VKITELIKTTRVSEKRTQKKFGVVFGVGGAAVSLWEAGKREAPYRVIEYCLQDHKQIKKTCPTCNGTGKIVLNI